MKNNEHSLDDLQCDLAQAKQKLLALRAFVWCIENICEDAISEGNEHTTKWMETILEECKCILDVFDFDEIK